MSHPILPKMSVVKFAKTAKGHRVHGPRVKGHGARGFVDASGRGASPELLWMKVIQKVRFFSLSLFWPCPFFDDFFPTQFIAFFFLWKPFLLRREPKLLVLCCCSIFSTPRGKLMSRRKCPHPCGLASSAGAAHGEAAFSSTRCV